MTILLDTDVLIDVALDRMPHSADAAALLDRLEQRPGTAFLSWHTISNFYYLVSPIRGAGAARKFVLDLAEFVDVAPVTTESLRYAGQLPMRDFEDAMQVAAAAACGAAVIVTRNVRDFARSPIRAETVAAILGELARR